MLLSSLPRDAQCALHVIKKHIKMPLIKFVTFNEEKIGQGRENAKRYLQENNKVKNKIESEVKAFLGM